MSRAIGIDLGTTNSCMAVLEGDRPTVIPNSDGERTTPSVVAFTKEGARLVGTPARRQAAVNPDRTISSIKRDMGSRRKLKIDGKNYTPQEISAIILQKLKADAEAYLGEPVTDAVITVPAYFTDAQRQATKDAGTIAGLNVLRIINEPTAAALAYGVDKEEDRAVMVYDLGGGTFDVSILSIESGFIKVLATSGNNHLGGNDFDARIVDYVCDAFSQKNGVDLRGDSMAMQRITEACENAKKDLSSTTTSTINLPYITAKDGVALHLEETITRDRFEKLVADLVEATLGPARQAISDANLTPSSIGKVLMVGGSSRMPCVQEAVKRLTGREPSKGINPDESVAMGACLQSGVMIGKFGGLLLMDVTPHSLGVEVMGDLMSVVIPRNSTIPTQHSEMYTTASPFQSMAEINVLQGENQRASANRSIGRFRLGGIKTGMAGTPHIEVTFSIDANGIVHVSARDTQTGSAADIVITGSNNMSDREVEKAQRELAAAGSADEAHRLTVGATADAESLITRAEAIAEKMDREGRRNIGTMVKRLRKAIKKSDYAQIESESAELKRVLDRIDNFAG